MTDYIAIARQNRLSALEQISQTRTNIFLESRGAEPSRKHTVLAALAQVKFSIDSPTKIGVAGIAA
ncbi:hypothetical protein LCGC14_1724300 [marine sediment metagenome]|uniref:Uncharacterized protein n=1 Tax=marine sediment metagenome TaxID=412755 RepID=A0A0F9HZA3_9ZZZZ